MRRSLFAAVLALPAASFACGASPSAKSPGDVPAAHVTAPSTTAAVIIKRTTSLKRAEVKAAIARGLGYFLQNVTVEDYPVMRRGKFYGFKLKTINAELGVDLRPGDVVTKVNGLSIEHPEEADAAMRTLEKASELRVDFDRDGKTQTLAVPITND